MGNGSLGYIASHTAKIPYFNDHGPLINLGLATSPIGPPKEIQEFIEKNNFIKYLSQYSDDPMHLEARNTLIKNIGLKLDPNQILFHSNGSYGVLDEIIRFLSINGHTSEIIVPTMSFPNISQLAQRYNVKYTPVKGSSLNPRESMLEIKNSRIVKRGSMVYIDIPNNPYGLVDIKLTKEIVKISQKRGAIPVIDMAFGEILGEEFKSLMRYINDKGGICTCSLSKCLGLPGIRSGYAVLPEKMILKSKEPKFYYKDIDRLAFQLNALAEKIIIKLFETKNDRGESIAQRHYKRLRKHNVKINKVLRKKLEPLGFSIGESDLRVGIKAIFSDNPNLYQELLNRGVITESLSKYSATLAKGQEIGDNAVRIVTPHESDIDEVIKRFKLITED